MSTNRVFLTLLIALGSAGLDRPPFPGHDQSKIQVLLITGYNSTPAHHWREVDPQLRQILEASGRFEVRIEEEPRGTTGRTFAGYDVLLLDYSDYTPNLGTPWPEETREAYLQFLRNGGGVVAFHVTVGSFPEWDEFRKTLGIEDYSKIGHGPYHDFVVKDVAPADPIMRGIPESFAGWGEIYHQIRLSSNVRVLASAWDDPDNCLPNRVSCGTGNDTPVLWTNRYGNGRVFVTTLGHDLREVSSPEFQATLVQGAMWAANRDVDVSRRSATSH